MVGMGEQWEIYVLLLTAVFTLFSLEMKLLFCLLFVCFFSEPLYPKPGSHFCVLGECYYHSTFQKTNFQTVPSYEVSLPDGKSVNSAYGLFTGWILFQLWVTYSIFQQFFFTSVFLPWLLYAFNLSSVINVAFNSNRKEPLLYVRQQEDLGIFQLCGPPAWAVSAHGGKRTTRIFAHIFLGDTHFPVVLDFS